MAKAGNLKLNFVAKSIGIHFFGFEDTFRCYRDNENLKIHFGRMDTLSECEAFSVFSTSTVHLFSLLPCFPWL